MPVQPQAALERGDQRGPLIVAGEGTGADHSVIAQQGPATPDHVIRTKRLPLLGRDVATYARDYERYFAENAGRSAAPLQMLDAAPRVVVDAHMGVVSAGRSAADASVVADIYRHTIEIILDATELGGYRALSAEDIFDVERAAA